MRSLRFTISSVAAKVNDKIRIAPAEVFCSLDSRWLVLHDELLLCPETGQQFRLECSHADCAEDQFVGRLVEGARYLSGDSERPLGLLLPLSQFLYSHYSIQLADEYLGNRDIVRSSIALQKDLLLPAIEQEVALGAATGQAGGVAFWLPEQTLSRMEELFAAAGLHLVAVLPRSLAAGESVLDEDSTSCTVVRIEQGGVTEVLSAFRQDLESADIRRAWDEQTAPLLEHVTTRMNSHGDWLQLGKPDKAISDYLFYTQEFRDRVANRNRQRQVWAGSAFAAAAVLVLSLPFIYQWVDTRRLEGLRDEYRSEARMAREYLNEIEDLEAEWGVVYEYPEADVPAILTSLNAVIRNSLTSFSLNDSVVEIQGFTRDPEQLTRLLVDQPQFERIEQSRSISESNSASGDRFGLRLTLSGYDYAEYSRKYDFK